MVWLVYTLLFLSVVLGSIATLFIGSHRSITLLLAFSGAYLFSVCILHLVPEAYAALGSQTGFYILVGFLIQVLLGYFSHGIEHGHLHEGERHLPLKVLISLYLHSFMEGMSLGGGIYEETVGKNLLAGIVLHKVAVAVVVATVLMQMYANRNKVWLQLMFFALMAPLGMGMSSMLGQQMMSFVHFYDIVLAVVVGMFIHISTIILFESSHDHRYNSYKLMMIILGMGLALLGLLIH